jgi:hypothetical protein
VTIEGVGVREYGMGRWKLHRLRWLSRLRRSDRLVGDDVPHGLDLPVAQEVGEGADRVTVLACPSEGEVDPLAQTESDDRDLGADEAAVAEVRTSAVRRAINKAPTTTAGRREMPPSLGSSMARA